MQIFSAINNRAVRRKLAHISLAVMFLLSQFTPALALAPVVEPPVSLPPQLVPPQPVGGVKTGPRTVTLFTAKSDLSTDPIDLEISTTRIFSEPLTPMSSAAVAGENQAIVKLVQSLKSRRNPEDVSALTDFISAFPNSRWRPSIESYLADMYLGTGYLTRAIAGWESVWDKSKSEKNAAQIAVANHAMANLLTMYAQLGMKDELKSRFAEIEGRPFFGSDETKINGAHIGYMDMVGNEKHAFKCGPYAVNTLLNLEKNTRTRDPIIEKAASTANGTNLLQIKNWADQVGLKMQAVKRTAGASLVVPSVMHWKLKHFAAIVAEKNGKYLLKDPTFGNDGSIWMSAAALDEESDGYFLIPSSRPLPSGWMPVTDDEAKTVWGKGGSHEADHNEKGCKSPTSGAKSCEKPCGMAVASAYSMQATLTISDKPLFYNPPVGPNIDFVTSYDHLQTNQPSTFTFTNLGQNWNFNWLSYLTVDPITSVATLRKMGGGSEIFTPDIVTGLYSPSLMSQATLVLVSPGVYQRKMPDGSMQVYNQSDISSPPRIFMTQVIDRAGNAALVQYDANFRITTITDSIGQVSTVNYISNTVGNVGFYKISSIVDPFARSCSFTWDSTTTLLLTITDVVGLKSQFTYDSSSSFITSMSTPYGTTSFYKYVPTYAGPYPAQGLKITYPDGTSDVLESYLAVQQITYFWDRHATQLYPADPANQIYTHCEQMKWLLDFSTSLMKPVPQFTIHPLESVSPIYYRSQGQGASLNFIGTTDKITEEKRYIGNAITIATVGGTVVTGDQFYFSADGQAQILYTVLAGDTLTSITTNLISQINSNAGMQAIGVTAVQITPTSFSLHTDSPLVAQYRYAPFGGVVLTIAMRSQTEQTANVTIGGTMTAGDTVNLDIALPYPNNFSQRVTHTVVGGDTPTTVAASMAAKINADPLFAQYPYIGTSSGPVLKVSSFSGKVVDYGSFIGGAGSESIVVSDIRNGTVKLSTNKYNNLGKMTESVDPVNRKFTYVYDSNNIDLLQQKETQGTNNFQMSAWTWNAKHMPLTHTDGSGRVTTYVYNSLQQPISVTDANSNVTTMTYTGTSSATIGGTVTAGNVLTITVFDAGLAGGQKAVNYTVIAGNTLTTIATGLKNAINADVNLQAIGVTATSSAAVITLKSTSITAPTTYTQSVSGGSTETIALGANTFGFLTKIDGPLTGNQDVTTIVYDGFNRVFSVSNSTGYTKTFNYDNMNRRTKTIYPDTTFEQTVWSRLDPVMTKDRIGRWSQTEFDSMDQVAFDIDPLGRKTQYTWCSCGSILTLTDPANHTTSWGHDLQGRTTSKTYADSTAINYVYEPYGSNLRSRTDALSQITNYLYYPDDKIFQTSYKNAVNPTASTTTAWDANYDRVKSVQKNDWGTISYTYNPYILPLGTPTTGGGMLQLVLNDRMANSDITFVYDNLGRTTNRSINGAANSDSWTFDAMSRVTGETNALGSFSYAYVNDTAGSSKGSTRLASITYPNSQVTKYSWYPAIGDERLQQIANLKTSSGPTISQFSHVYNPAGEMTQWNQLQDNKSVNYMLGYDQAGQLTGSQASPGQPSANYIGQNYFAYDVAANRTGVQQNSINRVKFGGTVTTGNALTITVKDSALTGGQKALVYTVVGGDTLSTIATKFAALITADTDMQTLGVNASANGSLMSIKSASPNITTYSQSTSGGATTTIALGVTNNFVENAVIGGTKTTGNIVTITVSDAALAGGQTAINYVVLAGDTLTTMATGLRNAINANAGLTAAGISATSAGTVITIKSTSANATTYSQSTSVGATATIALSINQNGPQTIALSGTKTTGDTITITVYDAGLAGALKAVTHTVLAGDTLTSIATGLAAALTADTNLQAIGVSATSAGTVVTLQSNSINQTVLRETTSLTATELISLNIPANGVQTAVIAGTKTTGDVVTITTYDAALPGGSQAVNYTVLAGDTLTSIAAGLAAAITANANLSAIGVSATSSATVINVKSASINNTTYAKSTSGGATETITLAPSSSVAQYGHNNVNELTSITGGGATRFQGTTNKALKSATINSLPADLAWSKNFNGNAILANGANNVPVSATDGANVVKTHNYQVPVTGPASATLTFDANGNMTSNGMNTYAWDAENRLIKITYPGSGNFSQILYDASNFKGQITETVASSLASTKQFVNSGSRICEERDASSAVTKKFFGFGQTSSGINYFYTLDHLGSVRDMTDGSGVFQARYEYDMWGVATKTSGSLDADFQYAGYYAHGRSGLNLTVYRAYSPLVGRWLNRDPIEEAGGMNLYVYCLNMPLTAVDPNGTVSGKPHCPSSDECEDCFDTWERRQKYCGQKYAEDLILYGFLVANENYKRCLANAKREFDACYAEHCR